MADEAILNSPEIRSIDNQISGARELLKGERRQLGIPDIAVIGGFHHVPYAGGAGSEARPPPGFDFPGRQTFTWNVGAAASLTLFDGTSNYARIRRTFREIDRCTPTAPSSPSGSNKTCAALCTRRASRTRTST